MPQCPAQGQPPYIIILHQGLLATGQIANSHLHPTFLPCHYTPHRLQPLATLVHQAPARVRHNIALTSHR